VGDALGHLHYGLLGHVEGRVPVGVVLVDAPGAQLALNGAGVDRNQDVPGKDAALRIRRGIPEQDRGGGRILLEPSFDLLRGPARGFDVGRVVTADFVGEIPQQAVLDFASVSGFLQVPASFRGFPWFGSCHGWVSGEPRLQSLCRPRTTLENIIMRRL